MFRPLDDKMVKPAHPKKSNEEVYEEKRALYVQDILRKLPQAVARKEKVNESLTAVQELSTQGGMFKARNKEKTSTVMQQALKACESEVEGLRRILADIEKIRGLENKAKMKCQLRRHALMDVLQKQAASLPLYVCGLEEFPPGGVGGIPYPENHHSEKGDIVAAYIDDNWILAEVNNNHSTGKVEVSDIEDENRTVVTIAKRRVVPLPYHRADPTRDPHALFPQDAIVLALYPQTTCFYKGAVITTPQVATDDYTVAFEDSSYAAGYSPPLPVPQRYVVTYREVKYKKRSTKGVEDD